METISLWAPDFGFGSKLNCTRFWFDSVSTVYNHPTL